MFFLVFASRLRLTSHTLTSVSHFYPYTHLYPCTRALAQLDDTEKRLKHYERTIFDLKVKCVYLCEGVCICEGVCVCVCVCECLCVCVCVDTEKRHHLRPQGKKCCASRFALEETLCELRVGLCTKRRKRSEQPHDNTPAKINIAPVPQSRA